MSEKLIDEIMDKVESVYKWHDEHLMEIHKSAIRTFRDDIILYLAQLKHKRSGKW